MAVGLHIGCNGSDWFRAIFPFRQSALLNIGGSLSVNKKLQLRKNIDIKNCKLLTVKWGNFVTFFAQNIFFHKIS